MSKPLLGIWNLVSWDLEYQDGPLEPYGPLKPQGFLLYSSDGNMAVSIYEVEESRLITSYGGPYEYHEGQVVHYPVQGLSPNGVHNKKVRFIDIDQDLLTLTTAWSDGTDARVFRHRLQWVRSTN